MNCPKCNGDFESVNYKGVVVDRCYDCRGLWFDAPEKDLLKGLRGAESIDIGEENVGRDHNKNVRIDCPRCKVAMIAMVDKDQFHIQYEHCPSCFGTFFDAGEFRDLKEHTIVERFRQMVDTVRSNLKRQSCRTGG
jgi:Zn-finger nucleic acid-binding protein